MLRKDDFSWNLIYASDNSLIGYCFEIDNILFANKLQISCDANGKNILLFIKGIEKKALERYRIVLQNFKNAEFTICDPLFQFTLNHVDKNIDVIAALVDEKLLTENMVTDIKHFISKCPIPVNQQLPPQDISYRVPELGWNECVSSNKLVFGYQINMYYLNVVHQPYAKEIEIYCDFTRGNMSLCISEIANNKIELYRTILAKFSDEIYELNEIANKITIKNIDENLDILSAFVNENILTNDLFSDIQSSISNCPAVTIERFGNNRLDAHYKDELIIKIPVLTENVNDFTVNRNDQFTYSKVTDLISSFLIRNFIKLGIIHQIIAKDELREIVKNAYDSYILNTLTPGKHLAIKVMIEKNHEKINIKIKDNGSGFKDYSKGVYLDYDKIHYQNKYQTKGSFGGAGLGLGMFSNNAKKMNAIVTLKNRKEAGATICMAFKY